MALLKSTGSKKVNLDFNKEFINTFSDSIEKRNIDSINKTIKDLHEADIANLIENLTSGNGVKAATVVCQASDQIKLWHNTTNYGTIVVPIFNTL